MDVRRNRIPQCHWCSYRATGGQIFSARVAWPIQQWHGLDAQMCRRHGSVLFLRRLRTTWAGKRQGLFAFCGTRCCHHSLYPCIHVVDECVITWRREGNSFIERGRSFRSHPEMGLFEPGKKSFATRWRSRGLVQSDEAWGNFGEGGGNGHVSC